MAHNSPYYLQQHQRMVQQQQIPAQQPQTYTQYQTQYYQQPQNIFQQLGQPQPQAHLQRHSTYTAQQQQQALLQPSGYQYTQQQQQQQFVQRPPPVQTPFQPQQQQPYAPPQTPFGQYSPTQPYTIQPPQAQTSYLRPQPPITQGPSTAFIPTSSFPPGTVGYGNSAESKQVAHLPTRPPISPSAIIAHQVQTQARTPVPVPQPPGRRPLPQPSGSANTPTSALPVTPSAKHSNTFSNRPVSVAASQFPQSITISQSAQPESSTTPSPTRSRPLPTPNAGKRATVDLGRISGLPASAPDFGNSSTSLDTPATAAPSQITIRSVPSPVKSFQNQSSSSSMSGGTVSRTTSIAVGHLNNNSNETTPKRRNSPPRFQAQSKSASSSPTKEDPPKTSWNSSTTVTTNSSSSKINNAATSASVSNTGSSPKKFTPIWKRTIPDYPAPVFGYAAGMVSDPYSKPAQPQTVSTESNLTPKGKQKKSEDVSPNQRIQSILPYLQPTPPQSQYPYTSPQSQSNAQIHGSLAPASYGQRQEAEEDDDDDEEEETDEEIAYQYEGSDYSEESQPKPSRKKQQQKQEVYNGQGVLKKSTKRSANYEHRLPTKGKDKKSEGFVVVKTKPAKKANQGQVSSARDGQERGKWMSEDDWEELQRRDFLGRRGPSDKERRVEYSDEEYEGKRKFGHQREHESSEGRRKLMYEEQHLAEGRRKSPTKGRPKDVEWSEPTPAPQRNHREVSSRKLKMRQLHNNSDEEDEEEEEEEMERYGHRRFRPKSYGKADERERDRSYSRGVSALPQPPSMPGGAKGPGEKPRVMKFKKAVNPSEDDEDDEYDGRKLASPFSTVKIEANRWSSGMTASSQTGAWPADLPRLPRTPGGSTPGSSSYNDSGGDYFSARPSSDGYNSSKGSGIQGGPIKGEAAREAVRLQMDLDDSPPRSLRSPSPAPSASSSSYSQFSQSRPLPQPQRRQQDHQQHDFPNGHMRRRQSLYSLPLQEQTIVSKEQQQRRPQSQIYGNSSSGLNGLQDLPQRSQDFSNSNSRQFQRSALPTFDNQPSQPKAQMPMQMQSSNQHHNNAKRFQRQTPAPPPNINIESPAPVGGRDRMADIPKMEEGGHLESRSHTRGRSSRMENINSSRNIRHIRSAEPSPPPSIPEINIDSSPMMNRNVPMININPSITSINEPSTSGGPTIQVYEIPGISVAGPEFEDEHIGGPRINLNNPNAGGPRQQGQHIKDKPSRTGGLICAGCQGPIVGRIVSAMGIKWHPQCFRCTVCQELLEHVSSYEHEGRPYCHLDYHENFAPKCYSCKTSIIEEQFISLDDPALGKRTYHIEHFFCAECGDPFLTPSMSTGGELALSGDGEFEGFTVYRGHPYCEACHVRLRLPKCKKCKKSIRDHDQAVEALGGKWCWACFVCDGCRKPFDDPSFFQRDNRPFCENCFSIILRNEM